MSGLAETSPNPTTSARPRVTDVVRVIDATALSVRIASGRACCEFATHQGLVRVLLPAERFLFGARTERDANGQPYPPVRGESQSEANLRLLESDADVVPISHKPRGRCPDKVTGAQKCAAAWEAMRKDPTLTARQASVQFAVSRSYLANWISDHHREEWIAVKTAASAARHGLCQSEIKAQAALEALRANDELRVYDAAQAQGLLPAELSRYLTHRYGEEWSVLKIERQRRRRAARLALRQAQGKTGGPVLKPGGKIL